MAAYTALLMVEVGFTARVHMVYSNEYLMQRDQRALSFYWEALGDRVQFHVGLDGFVPTENEAMIVDEADHFIYADLQAFLAKTKGMPTLCYTATIGGNGRDEAEKNLLGAANFRICDTAPGLAQPLVESLSFNDAQGLASFLKKELCDRSVLLRCTESMLEELTLQLEDVNPVLIHARFDDKVLAELEKRAENGKFRLLVATDGFGMRGIDYRASTLGLTLVIGEPFANTREAFQGLYRVGRFDDPCKRFIVQGVELID